LPDEYWGPEEEWGNEQPDVAAEESTKRKSFRFSVKWGSADSPDLQSAGRLVGGNLQSAGRLAGGNGISAHLMKRGAVRDRRSRFGQAVAALSAKGAKPISAERARREAPCGGWAGPGCSNLTKGLEVSATVIPIAVSMFDLEYGQVAALLAQAVTEHAVWHDAYGYLYRSTCAADGKNGQGPGYVYAGCIFGSCDPANPFAGQIDGILYQIARIAGVWPGPACGPKCKLKLPM
jgi:hypothetical protein